MKIETNGLFKDCEYVPGNVEIKELSSRGEYLVGVFWRKDGGYGGMNRAETLVEAKEMAKILERLGYDKPGVSEIRIVKTHKQVFLANFLKEPPQ